MNFTISSWFGWETATKREKNVSKMRYNIIFFALLNKKIQHIEGFGWHSYNVTIVFCLSPSPLSLSLFLCLCLQSLCLICLECVIISMLSPPELWPSTWTTRLVLQLLSLPLEGDPDLWHHFQRLFAFLQ